MKRIIRTEKAVLDENGDGSASSSDDYIQQDLNCSGDSSFFGEDKELGEEQGECKHALVHSISSRTWPTCHRSSQFGTNQSTSELMPDNANEVSKCPSTPTTIQQDAQEVEIRGRRKERKTKEQIDEEALERLTQR